MNQCQGIKADDTRCERLIGASQEYCYSHDKSRATERKTNASRAAKSKAGPELVAIKRQLKEIAEGVLVGRISTGEGSVAAQVLGVYLRACEQERKQREYDELRGEMVELRGMLEQGQGSAGERQCTG
jgi:hypothetical protein